MTRRNEPTFFDDMIASNKSRMRSQLIETFRDVTLLVKTKIAPVLGAMDPSSNIVIAYFVLFLVAFGCFSFSIAAEFTFDDSEAILNNPDVKKQTSIGEVFQSDFWGTKLNSNSSHKSFRPLAVLTFRFLKNLNGGELNSHIFHFANVIAHCFVTLLVFNTLETLLNSGFWHLKYDYHPNLFFGVPFMTSLLFAIHPIHSEAVCSAVGIADLLSAAFTLIALRIYASDEVKSSAGLFQFIQLASKLIILAGVFLRSSFIICIAGAAMLFKEQGITVLGICCALDILSLVQELNQKESKTSNKLILLRILLLTIGCGFLISLRLFIMNFTAPVFQDVDNPASFLESAFYRFVNYNYIYALNVWIILYPIWLCFDWSMGCIPLITSWLDFRMIIVIIFWFALAQMLYGSLFHHNHRIRSRLQLCLVLAVIPFIPASNLFLKVGFVIAERTLYLPSLGVCLLIVSGIQLFSKYLERHSTIKSQTLFYIWCIFLVARSLNVSMTISLSHECLTFSLFQRSLDWLNEQRLFASGLDVCPLNAKVHYNVAKLAADNGNKQLAIEEYDKAIKLNPHYYFAMNNLANILKDINRSTEAEQLLKRATELKPDFAVAWMNLGIVQTTAKNYAEAEKSYFTALKYRHKYADCMFNLGNLYLEQKRYRSAAIAWRNSTIIKPKLLAAWNNLILMLDSIGEDQRALHVAEESLKHLPKESSLHFNYANILGKINRFKDAERHFLIALNISKEAVYYANLGVLYHRWKKYSKAKIAYKNALLINPNMQTTKENLQSLMRIK
ncbi:transmembrane and TPR repeat-containing protein 4-like protein [Dinothrombium tinctorium]|uniref:dolichyl-phosphate-mannose--protein mannosyltransferase n=1 Tax=Dinothrombium tinctorium TaxID=1965070 RepID=A0A443RK51_9ACAR|nr:transmembrane and TPR repeat-containing protein 4-like protein [Dinothrombium tinctorium]RWS15645.1 transmembrane and TPR repeat-containing protein 4-like protein [Dinothrombium tinctorium]